MTEQSAGELLREARKLLSRYVKETPIGHQPPMISLEATALLARIDDAHLSQASDEVADYMREYVEGHPLTALKAARKQASEPISQGICETTLTERFAIKSCECGTYPDNLGPCKTFLENAHGRCTYCDHGPICHMKVLGQTPDESLSTRQASERADGVMKNADVSLFRTRVLNILYEMGYVEENSVVQKIIALNIPAPLPRSVRMRVRT